MNYLDGLTCVSECPVSSYPNTTSSCQPCNGSCLYFSTDTYTVFPREDVPVNSTLAVLQVTDRRVVERPIQFSLLAGNLDRLFHLNSTSGTLTVISSLDREREANHSLVVIAFDSGTNPISTETAQVTVTVIVGDVNDNPPIFEEESYSVSVAENQPVGTSLLALLATDADEGSNSEVVYSFTNDGDAMMFQLDPISGDLQTATVFDFESIKSYNIRVIASDGGLPSLSAIATIEVTVLNENDVRPIFTETHYTTHLSENVGIGTSVAQLIAADADSTTITYEILGGNDSGDFILDPISGLLLSANTLDFETQSSYNLSITVTDGVPNPFQSGMATVVILVSDVNDNPPTFSVDTYTVSLTENNVPNTLLLNLTASDADSGSNADIEYSIEAGQQDVFLIDSVTGELFVLTSLNREQATVYELVITAVDGGLPQLTGSTLVRITVEDSNDNSPVFLREIINGTLLENQPTGAIIAIFTAVDGDDGLNGAVTYSIENDNHTFSINPLSGAVSLVQSLDYELATTRRLNIRATDGGTPQRFAMATLFIRVVDINDNAPTFSDDEYSVTVSEGLGVGSSVIQVEALDSDSGTNAEITFELIGGNQQEKFSLDPHRGLLSLSSPLDFETRTTYLLTLLANNSASNVPLVTTAIISVTVSEVNEFTPLFTQSEYEAEVSENQPIGTSVLLLQAVDLDAGSSGEVVYRFISGGNEGDILSVSTDGEVVTLREFDREQSHTYHLIVEAFDNGSPSLSSRANLTLTISDQNDSPPEFSLSHYTASLPEDSTVGTALVTSPPILASDADSVGPYSEVSYTIESGDPGQIFTIDPLTGVVQLTHEVDYESVIRYDVIIVATDSGEVPLSSSATVRIDIEDVNDNRPTIFGLDEHVSFTEGDIEISVAANMTISDADTIPLESLTITLNGQPNDMLALTNPPLNSVTRAQFVEITDPIRAEDATSILRSLVFRNLEDEPTSDVRTVVITVLDGGYTVSSEVSVEFQLINDNQPLIDLDTADTGTGYSTVFTEEGPAVKVTSSSVSVSDFDSEQSGIYSICARILNSKDGNLEGLQLSLPVPSALVVDISAHTLNVSSEVIAPFSMFEAVLATLEYYNVANEPSSPLHRVIEVAANDGEFTSPPAITNVTIVLVNDPPTLRLGAMTDNQVEFNEGVGPIRLTSPTQFVLSDSDNLQLMSASITLTNAPDANEERLLINGDAPTNISIILTGHQIIVNGSASVAAYADLLRHVSYDNELGSPSSELRNVRFVVSDGTAETTATTSVTFNLVNDPPVVDLNGPQMGVNNTVNFSEGAPPVAIFDPLLTVSDVDSELIVSAFIELTPTPDGNQEGLQINSLSFPPSLLLTQSTSVIFITGSAAPQLYSTVLQSVAYYNTAKEPVVGARDVRVFVNDGEFNSTVVVVTIFVNSVNDIPVFIVSGGLSYTAVYVEESPQAVGVVNEGEEIVISDSDNMTLDSLRVVVEGVADSNAEVLGYLDPTLDDSLSVGLETTTSASAIYTFTFSSESSTYDNFQQLTRSLAYQNTKSEPTAGVRIVRLSISDGLVSSPHQTSSINVTLINDNIPSFQRFIVQASVLENTAPVTVTTVVASDEDQSVGPFGDHGRVRYAITSGNEDGFFEIDRETGVISLIREKDREDSATGAVLIVTAENVAPLDVPGSYPTIIVLVSVLDMNDNAPQFEGSPYQFEINEHSSVDVGAISAVDADIGVNSDIYYTIILGNQNNIFSIEQESGVIGVINSNELDRETQATHVLTISAIDQGSPALSNRTTVEITLIDINDNVPIFSSDTPFSGDIMENAAIGSRVLIITATDADVGSNGDVTYSLIGTSTFEIDADSGVIETVSELDRETVDSFTFNVVATDSGGLQSTAEVRVQILDVNDNAPVFSMDSYSFDVLENTLIGQLVSVVMATDEDLGSNAELLYSINSTLVDLPFSISETMGTITVSDTLDRETVATYQFQVIARDSGGPSLSSLVSVTAIIGDVNDNAPQFFQSNYDVELLENVPQMTLVFTAIATDSDAGSNGDISYSLVSAHNAFAIDPITGELFTVASIDREIQDSYPLEIVASDAGSPALSSVANLFINITDVNDNRPIFSRTNYEFSIVENVNVSTLVGTVMATDADKGSNARITYAIPDGIPEFSLDGESGQIMTELPIDREQQAEYSLTVIATDAGSPRLDGMALVHITVLDSNDFIPEFLIRVYNLTVPENTLVGSELVIVEAVDEDEGTNADIFYQLQDNADVFSLHSELGTLRLVASLDAEMTDSYTLMVEASDRGTPQSLSSTALVNIQVLDVNDNAPVISPASVDVEYVEESEPVTLFQDITLSDDDITGFFTNATVHLETPVLVEDRLVILEQDTLDLSVQFSLNSTQLVINGHSSGGSLVSILRTVQYQNINPEPEVRLLRALIQVSDGLFTANAQAVISLVSVNDHRPIVFLDGQNFNLNTSLTYVENSGLCLSRMDH